MRDPGFEVGVSEIMYPVILKQGCIKLSLCHTFYIVVVYGTFAESQMRKN